MIRRQRSIRSAVAIGLLGLAAFGVHPVWSEHAEGLGQRLPAQRSSREPGRGSFLIASHRLEDGNFSRTVVLMLEVSDQGALGVVINRSTSMAVSEALPQLEGFEDRSDVLFAGGPVEPLQPLFIARLASAPESAEELLEDGVFVVKGIEAVREVLASAAPSTRLRVFAGYAGWGPGQLQAEIGRADWHVMPASSRWIFDEPPESVWSKLIEIVLMPTA